MVIAPSCGLVSAAIQFDDVTDQLGPLGAGESWGASWGDLNGDGWPDLFLSNHRLRAALYRNEGSQGFVDATLQVDRSSTWITTPYNDQHGGTWGDYDNDGDEDLFVSTGRSFVEQFFENTGGVLVDRTTWAGVNGVGVGDGRHAAWLDVNNDGLLDLLSVNFSDNLLWERQLGGTTAFVKSNKDYGFNRVCLYGNLTIELLDVVGDSKPEFLCVNDSDFTSGLFDIGTQPFMNLKDRIPSVNLVNDVALGDFDGDLRTDLFVLKGVLRLNEALQVAPTQIEASLEAGINAPVKGVTFQSNGAISLDVGTINFSEAYVFIGATGWHPPYGDGLTFTLDPQDQRTWGIKAHSGVTKGIYVGFDPTQQVWEIRLNSDDAGRRAYFQVTSTAPISNLVATNVNGADLPMSSILLRSTTETFEDKTYYAHLSAPLSCVSAVAGDFDNDMDLDLYLVCRGGAQNLPNRLFENDGKGRFTEVDPGAAAGIVGFNIADGAGTGDSVAMADFDLDGSLDLVVTNGLNMYPVDFGGPTQLFHNRGNGSHWIELDLQGTTSNRDGVGAKIIATAGGKAQLREQNGGLHRWSQNFQRLHFGLGSNQQVDLRVEWPSGQVDEYQGIAADQIYQITEGQGIQSRSLDFATPLGGPTPQSGNECGMPVYDLQMDAGLFVWKDCEAGLWHVRATSGGSSVSSNYQGRVSADRSFSSLTPSGLEGLDWVKLTNSNAIDYSLNLSYAGDDGFDFAFPVGAQVCLGLDAPAGASAYLGAERVPISLPFDLGSLGACGTMPALAVAPVTVTEGTGVAHFIVSLSSASTQQVSVGYATVDGTALVGSDYGAGSGTLTFAPGETEKTIDVTLLDDNQGEPAETFELVLSHALGATIGEAKGAATITDNDTPPSCGTPSLSAGTEAGVFLWQDCSTAKWQARVTAGGSTKSIVYNGELVASEAFTTAAGVQLELSGDVVDLTLPERIGYKLGVQASGVDGLAFSFPAGTSVCFWLDAPIGAKIYLGAGKVPMTMPFDLTSLESCASSRPTLSVSDVLVSEGDGVASFVVTLSASSSRSVTVDYTTSNGSAGSADYTKTAGTLTFAPGEIHKSIDVPLVDDTLVEASETFALTLSNATGASLARAQATGTIENNDLPRPQASVGDVTVNEGAGTVTFAVTLSTPASEIVTVAYETADGSAQAGLDFVSSVEAEELVFEPGETEKAITLDVIDDALFESTEHFYLTLVDADGADIARTQGTATLVDNDTASLSCGTPTFSSLTQAGVFLWQDCGTAQWHVQVTGGGATSTITYVGEVVSDTAFTSAVGTLLELPWDVVNVSDPTRIGYRLSVTGKGIDGLDFTFPNGAAVCFGLEAPANGRVYLGAGKAPMDVPFDLTTLESCAPGPALSVSDVTLGEGDGMASFMVSLSAASTQTVKVDYTTVAATASAGTDYLERAGTLTFAAGEVTQMVEVPIIDDVTPEPTESFRLVLSDPVGASIAVEAGIANLTDNDAIAAPACGAPAYNSATEAGTFIYYDCGDTQQWHVRVTAGGQSLSYRGSVSADQPFSSLVAVSQESSDVLTPVPFSTATAGPISFVQNVGSSGYDGFDFRLPPGSNGCFDLTAPTGLPVRIGADRVAVTVPISLSTFGFCSP